MRLCQTTYVYHVTAWVEILPWKTKVAFPGESKLRWSSAISTEFCWRNTLLSHYIHTPVASEGPNTESPPPPPPPLKLRTGSEWLLLEPQFEPATFWSWIKCLNHSVHLFPWQWHCHKHWLSKFIKSPTQTLLMHTSSFCHLVKRLTMEPCVAWTFCSWNWCVRISCILNYNLAWVADITGATLTFSISAFVM